MLGIELARLDARKQDSLITDDAVCAVGGCGIEAPCVNVRLRASYKKGAGLIEIDSQAVAGIEASCLSDQPLGEFGANTPTTRLIRIGERRATNRIPEAHMVALGGPRRQTGFNIT